MGETWKEEPWEGGGQRWGRQRERGVVRRVGVGRRGDGEDAGETGTEGVIVNSKKGNSEEGPRKKQKDW